MKSNDDARYLILSSQESYNLQIASFTIISSKAKKLLGINLNDNLKSDIQLENICLKANRKLNALARISNYMELPKRLILINAFSFIKSSLIIVLLFGCFIAVP